MIRRDFLKTSGAALLVPAIPARPEPPWVRELRARIEAIPEDGWDRVFCVPGASVQEKWIEVTVPGWRDEDRIARATGCVNREGFAGRHAGTVMLVGGVCWDSHHGTRLRFAVRRGLRWDGRRHPETGRVERVVADGGRPLYREFDFEQL